MGVFFRNPFPGARKEVIRTIRKGGGGQALDMYLKEEESSEAFDDGASIISSVTLAPKSRQQGPLGLTKALTALISSTLLSLIPLISAEMKTTGEGTEISASIIRRLLHEYHGRGKGVDVEVLSTDLVLGNGKVVASDKLAAILPQLQKDGVFDMSRWADC
jgi:hypothetical protein